MATPINYLLIGGYAAAKAALAIRERDAQGRIVLLTAEEHPPYERPPLSKQMLFEDDFSPEETYVVAESLYAEKNIDIHTGKWVKNLDRANKTVQCEDGAAYSYEKLLLAPGADAKEPEFTGADYGNVYVLRKLADSQKIRGAINRGGKVVVIGGSYLGLEVASGCLKKGLDVTIVDSHPGPWSKFASARLQKFLVTQYEKAGAKFFFNEKVQTLNGDGWAETVTIGNEAVITDFVVAALGSKLNLDLAKEAGLELDEKLGIIVDEHYLTSDPSIWAAGDAIHYPDPVVGKMWHNEHYTNACWSGEIAGANMTGESQKLEHAPYFFSDFLDLHMVMRGNPGGGKSARVVGEIDSGEFVELYGDEGGVLKMGVIMSHHKAKSETDALTLEKLVKEKVQVSAVESARFGL